ncbi:hypothetical protein HMPREF9592_00719 [Cutibacterium acnes HL046PA1]|nr:hypothetical protein HMPREF9592_00719 [Cutibacterium acnes HL046PA1]
MGRRALDPESAQSAGSSTAPWCRPCARDARSGVAGSVIATT